MIGPEDERLPEDVFRQIVRLPRSMGERAAFRPAGPHPFCVAACAAHPLPYTCRRCFYQSIKYIIFDEKKHHTS